MDAALTRDEAKAVLNRCLEEGEVKYTKHFGEELINDDLSTEDILRICKSGAIIEAPEKDIKTGQWKYKIEGTTSDNRRVAVVFVLRHLLAIFITVFERKQ
jgi:hypothetical protein